MFYVDVSELLDDVTVNKKLKCRLSANSLETDEYGNPIESQDIIDIDCSIVEDQENVFDVKTSSYLVNTVYRIYLDNKKYGDVVFDGAKIQYGKKVLEITGNMLQHDYSSHMVLKAVQKKVEDVI